MAGTERTDKRKANAAFTLMEVVMSITILALVMAGMIYGYVQTNRRAEWSAMSLDAQSFAAEAIEQVRAAQWALNGQNTTNQLQTLPASYTRTNTMLIPATGQATNVVTTVTVNNFSVNPALYQFSASCIWYFPGKTNSFTNIVITWRAPDR
ncbi:MAG TPA: prepilin-type N-terminal cleavage/methylation domain-containing protein [Candidatus Sulfopaludibacter sp.]|nr:prepilin-type N-terminal cleavage/methylation domain-containing protein [Candidatus Sulfopaludibacter sp.]